MAQIKMFSKMVNYLKAKTNNKRKILSNNSINLFQQKTHLLKSQSQKKQPNNLCKL